MSALYGAIESGGTKMVCAIGESPDNLQAIERIPTTTPEETLPQMVRFFTRHAEEGLLIKSLGIGSFGPIDPHPESPTYGYITSTPKLAWQQSDFLAPFREELNVPIAFDTDVNVAALGEGTWGAAQGLDTFIYLTIGTGIGGGGIVNGKMMHGLIHPEMGHIRVPHDLEKDPFPGICPYHGDCLEGLASGPAIEKRWKTKAINLSADHEAWDLEAEYLAWAAVNFICMLSPQKIIFGGGVMEQRHLFPKIHDHVQELLNGYVDHPAIKEDIANYIVPPGLDNKAGIAGGLALAKQIA